MTVRQISYRLKADGKAELQRDAKAVGDAFEDAGERGAEAFTRSNRILQTTGELSDKQVERYKKLAKAAQEAQRAEEAQARFNGQLGGGSGRTWSPSDFLTAEELGGRPGVTKGQRAGRLNLVRQGADVFTTGMMGMDPATIAIQQGPQILDALAQAGIKATPAMVALTGTVVGLAGAVVALGAAGLQYEAQQNRIDAATQGLGRTLQISAGEFDQYARAGAEAGKVSIKAATDAGIAYVSTGKIGGQVLGDLIGLTKRYALTTNQDVGAATQDLAKHFSTGSKGVQDLNDKLHFLSAAEMEHIKNLMDSGRQTEAQQYAVDRLKGSLAYVSSVTSGWDQVLHKLGDTAVDVWTKVGQAIAVAMGGGSDQQQLQSLLEKRSQAALEERSTWFYMGKSTKDYDREIEEVRRRIAKTAATAATAAANDRDAQRDAIVRRYQDPHIQARTDRQNDLDNYIRQGGRKGDATAKAIQADIDALKAGYDSAADKARKLEQAHDKAVRDGQKAAREKAAEARKDAREIEEAIRLDGARADHVIDNQRRVAQARGDESTLDLLARQGRLQEEINRWVREGLSLEQARVNARAQIADEMQAESDAVRKLLSNPEGFVSSNDRMASASPGSDFKEFKSLDFYAGKLRDKTSDAFRDGLMAGMTGGNFFQVFADRLKFAAADALANSLTTELFGSGKDGGKAGLIQTALKFFPKHAAGTSYAPGGLSIVGEYGPEIVDLPEGSKVRSAATTQAMMQSLVGRASRAGGGDTNNFHYSPTYNLQGTADEIRAMRSEIERDRKAFKSNAIAAYTDAKARRQIS